MELVRKLTERDEGPKPAVYQYSRKGILTLLRAKFVFFSQFGPDELPGIAFSKKTVTIQLWHGIPIKTIGACMKRLNSKEASRLREVYPRTFTYWISSSRVERDSIASCTGIPLQRVVTTGYPRNDFLIEQIASPSNDLYVRFPFLNGKIILYAPTYREETEIRFFPFSDFSLEALHSFLEKENAYLLLRGHYMDDIVRPEGNLEINMIKGERIISANREMVEDLQELLPYVDILISDYSGAWVDYLLLNRPIIFIPYDLETYVEERGLLYDFHEITPGPKVECFDDLMRALRDYLSDPIKDSWDRRSIKRMFHEFDDGMAFTRIRQLMKDHLQSELDSRR